MDPKPFMSREITRPVLNGKLGAISTSNSYATQAGIDILKKGGNAMDAAIAVALVLAVVEPYHTGIGGGGFSLMYTKKNDRLCGFEARGNAPIGAHRDLFLDNNGEIDSEAQHFSGKCCVVPGFYRTIQTQLDRYATMDLMTLSQPAIRLAREGYRISAMFEDVYNDEHVCHILGKESSMASLFLKDGKTPYSIGDIQKNPDLADTIELVAQKGTSYFYASELADDIVNAINNAGGVFCKEDLSNYTATERGTINTTYRGYNVVGMAPPSSGGLCIAQMLNILENFDLRSMGRLSADSIHVIAETMKMTFSDRAVGIGDPDFVHNKVEQFISKDYARTRAHALNMNRAQSHGPGEGIESEIRGRNGNTTHFSIIDKDGNVVSQTISIGDLFGNGILVKGRGIVLNNFMSYASPKPANVTTDGMKYGDSNCIEPGKIPMSSNTPTIVFDGNQPFLAIGAAGGPQILNAVLQTIINAIDYDMNMEDIVQSPHISCLTQQQGLILEPGISPEAIDGLNKKGHTLVPLKEGECIRFFSNGVIHKNGRLYPAGTQRQDGCGGAIQENGMAAYNGTIME